MAISHDDVMTRLVRTTADWAGTIRVEINWV